MENITHWLELACIIVGAAIGYGVLKTNLRNTADDLKEYKKDTNDRLLRAERDIGTANKCLEGLRVSVESIDQRTGRMEKKLDSVLENR